jgi:hypothetical protein
VYKAVQEKKRSEGNPMENRHHPQELFKDYASELVSQERRQDSDHKLIQWRCRYVVWKEWEASNGDTKMAEEEVDLRAQMLERRVTRLENQRERLHEQISKQLFKLFKGDAVISERVIPWLIPGGSSSDICYPVRIAGIHGDAEDVSIFAMLNQALDILPHEVVVFSMNKEVDTTTTIELGLRYCEDALHVRACLHGVEVDDRLLEVQFLNAMSNQVNALHYPLNPTVKEIRTMNERLLHTISINSVPGLSHTLATQAYNLERDLASEMLENDLITSESLARIKNAERKSLQEGKWLLHVPKLLLTTTQYLLPCQVS